jgi:hypothetical protein
MNCTGNTYSTVGVCERCLKGSAANAGNSGCDDLAAKGADGEAKVQITSAATAAQIVEGTKLLPQITMKIEADPAVLVEGSDAQAQLFQDLAAEMAAALGIDISDVEITGVRNSTVDGGDRRRLETAAIEFDFVIRSTNPAAALAQLESQIADETSQLRNSKILGNVDPSGTLAFAFICGVGLYRPGGATDCKRCDSDNEYPDPDDNARCLECQDLMTVKDDGSGCRCADEFYDARAELLVCYEIGKSWLASDFENQHAKNAQDPQCLSCGDCLKCRDGAAKVAPGFMVSEADKAAVAGSTSTCGNLASCCITPLASCVTQA